MRDNHSKRPFIGNLNAESFLYGSASGVSKGKSPFGLAVSGEGVNARESMATRCVLCGKLMPYPSNMHAETHGHRDWRAAVKAGSFKLLNRTLQEADSYFKQTSTIAAFYFKTKEEPLERTLMDDFDDGLVSLELQGVSLHDDVIKHMRDEIRELLGKSRLTKIPKKGPLAKNCEKPKVLNLKGEKKTW